MLGVKGDYFFKAFYRVFKPVAFFKYKPAVEERIYIIWRKIENRFKSSKSFGELTRIIKCYPFVDKRFFIARVQADGFIKAFKCAFIVAFMVVNYCFSLPDLI